MLIVDLRSTLKKEIHVLKLLNMVQVQQIKHYSTEIQKYILCRRILWIEHLHKNTELCTFHANTDICITC